MTQVTLKHVDRLHAGDLLFRRLRQRFVARTHVHDRRIAAGRGERHRVETGVLRRPHVVRVIGVPAVAVLHALPGLVLVTVRYFADEWTLRQCILREVLLHRLAEQRDRGKILLGREILVANDEGDVRDDRLVQTSPRFGIDRLAQIDTRHFGPDRRGELGNFHRGHSSACQSVGLSSDPRYPDRCRRRIRRVPSGLSCTLW